MEIHGVYGNPDSTQRFHGWNLIWWLSHVSALPWLCLGDFNKILNQTEKVGGVPRAKSLIQDFENAIVDANLHDLGLSGSKYTCFMDRRDGVYVRERFDRAFGTNLWCYLFPTAMVSNMGFKFL